jgi:hypothetical protein
LEEEENEEKLLFSYLNPPPQKKKKKIDVLYQNIGLLCTSSIKMSSWSGKNTIFCDSAIVFNNIYIYKNGTKM